LYWPLHEYGFEVGDFAFTGTVTGAGGVNTPYFTARLGSQQTGLSANTYNVTVTDANNCQITDAITVGGTPGAEVSISSSTSPLCNGDCNGTAVANITTPSLSPYSYSWSNGNTTTNTTNLTDTSTALCANTTYTVTLTDANNCTDTATVTLTEPVALTATTTTTDVLCYNGNDGTATVVANGGTPGYTYLWSTAPAQTGSTATNLQAANYTVTVTDANGCTTTSTVTINEPTCFVRKSGILVFAE